MATQTETEEPMAQDPQARITALEAELQRVRAEADAERERFERRLKLAQSALPERRDPRTVTQNVAAHQEIEGLRGALRERDRVVKELTGQVRSLEDQLEDGYHQMDALRRQLDQRDEDLAEARRQAARAAPKPASLPPRVSRQPAQPAPVPSPAPVPPPAAAERADALTFVIGVLVGALLTCALAVGLWWTGSWPAPPAAAARGEPTGAQGLIAASGRQLHGG
ncbi:hypothetical protein CKO31_08960 [Thiohalocapsa halophila]|uniref:Uncharacterized protein n=1 Tax=Thiohalocapsa halophila TaxID=69359 RepID=A0ABS1CG38_9GAMM|nr:hypothetical protein [Thiohalocapsa halophila]MBK1630870.1 hypothetical protein [Thiohalocapsa halophila]